MNPLLEIGLTNAILATLLAIVAAAVSRLGARPAVIHGLWLLVLMKLVTPPLVSLPVAVLPAVQELAPSQALSPPATGSRELPRARLPAAAPSPIGETSVPDLPVTRSLPERPASGPACNWPPVLCLVWLAGSACWFLLAAIRVIAFHRLARRAERAPHEWADRVAGLAHRFGLRACPDVRVTDAILPPMVWAAPRRAVLLLPGALFGRLEPAEQATLLAHELAHLCRGDHYVRWFEAIVLGLFWWHPVVWIACRAAQNAAERCCDQWVLRRLPGSNRSYANTLFATANFLEESRCLLPLGASGFGRTSHLLRRIEMVVQGPAYRPLSKSARLAATLAMGAALMISPVLLPAGESPTQPEAKDKPCSSAAASEKTSAARHVVMVDVTYLFRHCDKFLQAENALKARVTAATEDVRRQKEKIADLKRQVEAAQPGTPECAGLEKKQDALQAQLQIQVNRQKREFLREEVKIYQASWDQIDAAITRYAKQHKIDLVLRHRNPEDVAKAEAAKKKAATAHDRLNNEAQELQQRINVPVLYQSPAAHGDEEDITREVLAVLNGK
jgi:beta-lactamase regulating signal transducer with metallopeptidase domain/Skp family chaperone for outer membrane proteins